MQDEVVINGRWKQMAEDKEEPVSPDYEIGAIQEEEQTEDTFATETAEEPSKEEAETAEALQEGPQEESQEEPQEEVLEEWKD